MWTTNELPDLSMAEVVHSAVDEVCFSERGDRCAVFESIR